MKFTIGESQPKKKRVFSELIKWFEGTNHSHVFISWKDQGGLRWVAEAKGSGVRMLSNVEFKERSKVMNIYYYNTNRDNMNEVVSYIWTQLAKDYGFLQIYGLAEMRLLNKVYMMLGLKRKARNRFTDGDASQICCELAVRCVQVGLNKKVIANNIEQWGLRETQGFNNSYGKKQPKELVDKINGVI